MGYKFLDRVVDQIISETRIDYDNKRIFFPFSLSSFHPSTSLPFSLFSITHLTSFHSFSEHCRDIYGLNEREILYVWEKYVGIIINKINE